MGGNSCSILLSINECQLFKDSLPDVLICKTTPIAPPPNPEVPQFAPSSQDFCSLLWMGISHIVSHIP